MSRFKSKVIITVAVVLITCASYIMTFHVGANYAKPDVIPYVKNSSHTVTRLVKVEVEKPVPVVSQLKTIEVIKPVYIENTIEVPYEVPVKLKDWDSVEQLQDFLKNDDTDQRIILTTDSNGAVKFDGQCEDFALQLRDRAMAIGMYLSVQVLHPEEYRKWYPSATTDAYHAICMARIGNEFWYIEPSTDQCWLAMYLD